MKKIILIGTLFILIIPTVLNAQDYYVKGMDELRFYERLNTKINERDFKQYQGILGSPYLFSEFKDAEVLTKDSILYKGKLRYDMYADEMEYKVKDGIYWLANPERVSYIKIDSLKFIFYPEPVGKDPGTYYQLLVDGGCRLLVRNDVLFVDAVKAKPYQDPVPAKFIKRKDFFYLTKGKASIVKIGNKKSILKYLSDHSSELSDYIKQNHISLTRKDDLIKLVTFYNKLEQK